jgi:hypothetical protein
LAHLNIAILFSPALWGVNLGSPNATLLRLGLLLLLLGLLLGLLLLQLTLLYKYLFYFLCFF